MLGMRYIKTAPNTYLMQASSEDPQKLPERITN
jgi:hypothetical protein